MIYWTLLIRNFSTPNSKIEEKTPSQRFRSIGCFSVYGIAENSR